MPCSTHQIDCQIDGQNTCQTECQGVGVTQRKSLLLFRAPFHRIETSWAQFTASTLAKLLSQAATHPWLFQLGSKRQGEENGSCSNTSIQSVPAMAAMAFKDIPTHIRRVLQAMNSMYHPCFIWASVSIWTIWSSSS